MQSWSNPELELSYNPSSMYRETPYTALQEEPIYMVYNHRSDPEYKGPSLYNNQIEEPSYKVYNYGEEAPYQAQIDDEEESRYKLPINNNKGLYVRLSSGRNTVTGKNLRTESITVKDMNSRTRHLCTWIPHTRFTIMRNHYILISSQGRTILHRWTFLQGPTP